VISRHGAERYHAARRSNDSQRPAPPTTR
jgi:hypothetical protein